MNTIAENPTTTTDIDWAGFLTNVCVVNERVDRERAALADIEAKKANLLAIINALQVHTPAPKLIEGAEVRDSTGKLITSAEISDVYFTADSAERTRLIDAAMGAMFKTHSAARAAHKRVLAAVRERDDFNAREGIVTL